MTFATIYNAVADQVKDSSTAMITRIKQYINWTQQDIASRGNWDFLYTDSFFQCTSPYTTGTALPSNGSTSVVGTDTSWDSSIIGKKIRFASTVEYYTISAVGSTTTLTLDQNYVGTTPTSAVTYEIFENIYSLDSDVENVISMTNPTLNAKLHYISKQRLDDLDPNIQTSGVPYIWTESGLDSSDYPQIRVYPYPNSNYVIYYSYRKSLTDLSGTTDISLIPVKYHKLLYLGAVAQVYDYLQDPSSLTYWTQYENMLDDMKSDLISGSEDNITVINSNRGQRTNSSTLRLPPAHFSN